MRKTLRDKVFNFTSKKDLFLAPCHVLLGLSGGADSMALLHVLTHWETPLTVSAIHIHHGLRGERADKDERFVCAYCAEHDIPLTVVRADVAAVAEQEGLTLEEAGRRVRYEQFEIARCASGADYVLTAHTADDQAETVLMHLIRGCGIDGLTGIPAARDRIRRPMLCCARAEVEEYCALQDIPFVVDETNADRQYTRNDIRHRVLPLLREINPAVNEALLRLSGLALEDAAYLNDVAQRALLSAKCEDGYCADALAKHPTVIRRRAIRLMLRESLIPSFEEAYIVAADEAVAHRCGTVMLCDGYVFSVEQGVISVRKAGAQRIPEPIAVEEFPHSVRFGDFAVTLAKSDVTDVNVHKLFLQYAIDCDKIEGKLCVRCRRTGDYMHPVGRGVGKSLKKLMNEWRIPAHIRDTYPLLCDEKGVVLVPGYTCGERVTVSEATKHYLVCEMSKVQG